MTVSNNNPPVVTGTPEQGQVLTTSSGTWIYDLDYVTYAYQWRRCDSAGANCVDIGGAVGPQYTLQAADVGSRIRSRVTATEFANPTPPGGGLLSFEPPGFPSYSGYQVRTISNSSYNHTVAVGSNIDAIFNWTEPVTDAGGVNRRVVISGFRNAVIIGGEIHRTATTNLGNGVGIQVDKCTGTIHIEGVKMHGSGLIDALVATSGPESGGQPGAIVQVQNCYFRVNAINDAHADGFQIWGDPGQGFNGGVRQLRSDYWTIHSTWQGIFLGTHSGTIQAGDLRNTNIVGVAAQAGGTQSGMGWIFFKGCYPDIGGYSGIVNLTNFWGDNSIRIWNSYPNMVTPNSVGSDAGGGFPCNKPNQPARASAQGSDATGQFVHWPNAQSDVKGKMYIGRPTAALGATNGDFVPVNGNVGMSYVSPGYA